MGFAVTQIENANNEVLADAVNAYLRSLMPGDVSFFYFGGHGAEASVMGGGNVYASNWLISKEVPAQNDDMQRKALDAINLLRRMESKETRFNMMVLDCCRDDPLPFDFQPGLGLRYLPMHPTNSLVAFACAPGERAAELPGERNGVFAKNLLLHMETPGLNVDDLFRRVRNGVNQDTKGLACQQDPRCYSQIRMENPTLL